MYRDLPTYCIRFVFVQRPCKLRALSTQVCYGNSLRIWPAAWALPRGPAAVGEEAGAGDERSGRRSEEYDCRRDFLDRAEPAQGNPVEHPFAERRVFEERLG